MSRMCGALQTMDWGRGAQYQCVGVQGHTGQHRYMRKPRDRWSWWPRLVYRLGVFR